MFPCGFILQGVSSSTVQPDQSPMKQYKTDRLSMENTGNDNSLREKLIGVIMQFIAPRSSLSKRRLNKSVSNSLLKCHKASVGISSGPRFLIEDERFVKWINVDQLDHLKMEMEMEIPSVKASANSDIIFFFTSAQDGNKLLDDERLSLADDLKKAHDQNQNKSK
ncbi:hypothetical protein Tco_0090640 [Tanacetum coccineum]